MNILPLLVLCFVVTAVMYWLRIIDQKHERIAQTYVESLRRLTAYLLERESSLNLQYKVPVSVEKMDGEDAILNDETYQTLLQNMRQAQVAYLETKAHVLDAADLWPVLESVKNDNELYNRAFRLYRRVSR